MWLWSLELLDVSWRAWQRSEQRCFRLWKVYASSRWRSLCEFQVLEGGVYASSRCWKEESARAREGGVVGKEESFPRTSKNNLSRSPHILVSYHHRRSQEEELA